MFWVWRGASFLFIGLSLERFSPADVVFPKGLLEALSLGVILLFRHEGLPPCGVHWIHNGVVALLTDAIPGFLFALAQQGIPSPVAGIVNATTPLMTILVIAVAFRDHEPTINNILGLIRSATRAYSKFGDVRVMHPTPGVWYFILWVIASREANAMSGRSQKLRSLLLHPLRYEVLGEGAKANLEGRLT
ncbi:MAG: DMT family transporter, partial [Pontimonas sp.]